MTTTVEKFKNLEAQLERKRIERDKLHDEIAELEKEMNTCISEMYK